jgi:hypothetical protein
MATFTRPLRPPPPTHPSPRASSAGSSPTSHGVSDSPWCHWKGRVLAYPPSPAPPAPPPRAAADRPDPSAVAVGGWLLEAVVRLLLFRAEGPGRCAKGQSRDGEAEAEVDRAEWLREAMRPWPVATGLR